MTYDTITDGFKRDLSPLARRIYAAIVDETTQPHHAGYISSWRLEEVMGEELGLCGVPGPGNAAMKELEDATLVRELPELHCRYELTARAWQAHLAAERARAERMGDIYETAMRDLWNHPEFNRRLFRWVGDALPENDEATDD